MSSAERASAGVGISSRKRTRIEVKGRGGTRLQPGVDMLLQAKDFPKDAPVLLITDGMIEDDLVVRREHAYLLPRGCRLPFRAKGDVFYYER